MLLLVFAAPAAAQADYTIGPQDVLSVTVWGQRDLSGRYTVELDGTFTFPLIGRVKAAGLTMRQFEEELRKLLADGYFKNPQVSVAVEQYRSQRIFLMGEIKSPGTYPLTGGMTLLEALAGAGGLGGGASTEAIIIRAQNASGPLLPGQDTSAEVITVSVKELQRGNLAQNVALRDGDTIFVPRAQEDFVYIFGAVRAQGIHPIKKDTTVLQALSLAGGLTEDGSTGRIKIIRIVDGKKKELKAKLDDIVQPGDTIIVGERLF
ncbi:MAG: polysaccharide biosynthesis/export family protein [Acidobacteria bacterium]|nr:polysaccharide biosynthesis/export family protein [Acidobacteriota bacterium]